MRMPREELVGSSLVHLLPGQVGTGMLDLYATAVETGQPLVLDDYAYAHEIVGEGRRFDIRAIRVHDGLSFTWRDVTDRFNESQALAESEARYRLLADMVNEQVCWFQHVGSAVAERWLDIFTAEARTHGDR